MMHVRFNEAWHGNMHKQSYKLSGAQYASPLHIDETPHLSYLVRSRFVPNNIKCRLTWQGVKQRKLPI